MLTQHLPDTAPLAQGIVLGGGQGEVARLPTEVGHVWQVVEVHEGGSHLPVALGVRPVGAFGVDGVTKAFPGGGEKRCIREGGETFETY